MLVLDSGGVSYLARRTRDAAALLLVLRSRGHWPPVVPTVVLVECTQGHPGRDAHVNRFPIRMNAPQEGILKDVTISE